MVTAEVRIVLRDQVQASLQVTDERSSVCDVEMARAATLARRGHLFLCLRERTNCHSGGILFAATVHARGWERNASGRPVDHGLRLRIQDEASASELDWCEGAALELQPKIQQTRMSRYRASRDCSARRRGPGRMIGVMRERPGLGFEPDCDKDCVLRSSGERVVQTEGCEESSPSLHRLDCYGSRRFDLHAPISRSGCH